MENSQEFKLNDFYQAVILKTVGFPLLRLEKTNGRFYNFIFSDPENKAQEVINDYWKRKVQVVAKDLVDNINELKTRIYSGI